MSVKSGFFNSVDHDRQYTAGDISEIFNGLFSDGIFKDVVINGSYQVNNCLRVVPDEGLHLYVDPGKAWFDNTWVFNDTPYSILLASPNMILNRWDAVVLEVNKALPYREARFIVISGREDDNPVYPKIESTDEIHRYPLAYVYVGAHVTEIVSENIVDMVGSEVTPYAIYIGAQTENVIANNLTTTKPGYALDAVQGKVLGDRVPFSFGIVNGNYGYYNESNQFIPFLGSTNIVNLGSGTTFDLSSYPDYKQFVVGRNLFLAPTKVTYSAGYAYADLSGKSLDYAEARADRMELLPTLSYNASSGILTVSNVSKTNYARNERGLELHIKPSVGDSWEEYADTTLTITYNVYLIH